MLYQFGTVCYQGIGPTENNTLEKHIYNMTTITGKYQPLLTSTTITINNY